jgi:hypothetical protein
LNTTCNSSQSNFIRELYLNLRQLGEYSSRILLSTTRTNLNTNTRYDNYNHWMIYNTNQIKKACVYCANNKVHRNSHTRYYCQKCNVYLHIKCFVLFHTYK